MLSFDDGYRDFLEFALPQLRRRSLPANMNIIPECVLSGRPPWNVLLYDFLSSVSLQEAIAVELPGLAPLRNEDSTALKAGLGMRLSRFLKQRPAAERGPLWELFRERYMRGRSFDVTAMMTLHELRSMPGEISLGAHSFSHESMGYESDQFFQDDFRRCQTFFREHLDLPVGIYAFPNGSYRRSQIDWLLAQGVERVLLVDEKLAPLGKHPVLPRLTFSADTRQEAVLKGIGFGRRLARPGAD
ncbi:MAG: polysaccharide deacetylase family protein [Candidatus Eremiobacteraeota bacterium]|nr:polysaccharide deacetylase family protein [Candidatus Eremiobacteraeota bacterium]